MDFRKAGGLVPVRMHANSDQVTWIRWYRAAPGAMVFPGRHAFGCAHWEGDYDQQWQGPGIVDRTDLYANGRNRGYPGTCTPANLDWFHTGIPAGAPANGELCCGRGLWAAGGAALGGSGFGPPVAFRAGNACVCATVKSTSTAG